MKLSLIWYIETFEVIFTHNDTGEKTILLRKSSLSRAINSKIPLGRVAPGWGKCIF